MNDDEKTCAESSVAAKARRFSAWMMIVSGLFLIPAAGQNLAYVSEFRWPAGFGPLGSVFIGGGMSFQGMGTLLAGGRTLAITVNMVSLVLLGAGVCLSVAYLSR